MTRRRWFDGVLIGAASALALVLGFVALAHLTGLGVRIAPIGGALAFPGIVLGVAAGVAALVAGFALLFRPRARLATLVTGALAVIVLVALGIHLVTMPALVSAGRVPPRSSTDALRVVTWNVLQGAADHEARAELIAQTDADIAVFAELYASRAEEDPVPEGYTVLGERGIAVTVLVSDRLGAYRIVAADESGATSGIVVAPVDADSASPTVVATHLVRPGLFDAQLWVHGLDWVADHCRGRNALAVGDFNAAPVNMPGGRLGDCAAGASLAASWPTWLPVAAGASIDNVLAAPGWRIDEAVTLEAPGGESDHRPVFAELVPAP